MCYLYFKEQQHDPDLGDDEFFGALNEDMPEEIGMNEFVELFNWSEAGTGGGQSPGGSPRREESGQGSPNCMMNMGRQGSPFQCATTREAVNLPKRLELFCSSRTLWGIWCRQRPLGECRLGFGRRVRISKACVRLFEERTASAQSEYTV